MGFVFVVLLILIALAIIGPFIFGFALYKWLKQKTRRRTIYLLCASLFLPYSYMWYDGFYPSDSFYEEEFVTQAKIPFPKTGEITKKSASYPDLHGDYSACAQIQVSPEEFDQLLRHFTTDHSYSSDKVETFGGPEFSYVMSDMPENTIMRRFSSGESGLNAYFFVGFLNNHKTIIMYRVSS